ncbi:hypothetical protein HYT25_00355 [Candidatus Pacearchaeota archaeon]|nr:hypothetical protein [Candidatus Pacearchaeota archaeon]
MEETRIKCSECERDFGNEDALKMHNAAKHSSRLKKEKTTINYKKIRNWTILAVILAVTFYGIFWTAGNMNGNSVVNEDELDFSAPRGAIHWHPTLTIKIDDKIQNIPPNIGITNTVHFPIHTHNEDANAGVIHMENDRPTKKTVTLGYFFEVWEKTFNKNCIFDYCTDSGKLKMYVNGEENFDFQNYFMQDGDNIIVEYNHFE